MKEDKQFEAFKKGWFHNCRKEGDCDCHSDGGFFQCCIICMKDRRMSKTEE